MRWNLVREAVTGFIGELRILPTSKMELYAFCAKASILDVWQGCEYASELASKVKDVSF